MCFTNADCNECDSNSLSLSIIVMVAGDAGVIRLVF